MCSARPWKPVAWVHFKYTRTEDPNVWLLDRTSSNLLGTARGGTLRHFLDGDLFKDANVTIKNSAVRWFSYPVAELVDWERIAPPVRITLIEWREPEDKGIT